MYTLPAMRRTLNPDRGETVAANGFRTVLKHEVAPAAASVTPTPAPPAATGRIGTENPWTVTTPGAPAPATPSTTSQMAPTAGSLFGANPWVADAGGTGPNGDYGYNRCYFATPATAAKVAQMLGGTVVKADDITPFGPFKKNQPNLMVQLPNGKRVNAGLVAGFYSHGYTQQAVNQMIASETSIDLG